MRDSVIFFFCSSLIVKQHCSLQSISLVVDGISSDSVVSSTCTNLCSSQAAPRSSIRTMTEDRVGTPVAYRHKVLEEKADRP